MADERAGRLLARKMWRTLEPYHGMIYFTPHASAAYAALGITGMDGYFASRAAAMGPVPAGAVIAAFFNFRPQLVRHALPGAWSVAAPALLLAARLEAADRAIRDAIDEDQLTSDEMGEAADLARRAAEACPVEGRVLFAAHADLDWPEAPHLVLWQATTLLREFRGDGHVAALALAGLDGCEALVTHSLDPDAPVPAPILQATRGWTDDEWAAAVARLEARGLVADGAFTAAGSALRRQIEDETDHAALAPWRALGTDASDRLRFLVRPYSKAIVAAGGLAGPPAGAGPT